jgi:arachidonate 15-lipoxygenase
MLTSSDRRGFLRTSVAGGLGLGLAGNRSVLGGPIESLCREPLLPQDDPNPRARLRRLEKTRSRYTYDYTRVPTLPMVEKVPPSEEFSLPWLLQGANRVADLIENFTHRPVGARGSNALACRRVVEMLAAGRAINGGAADTLLRLACQSAADPAGHDRPESLDDYAALFRTIAPPAIVDTFQDDRVFARQRVGGANPLVIRQVCGLDDRFPVTDAIFGSVLPGDRLEAAAREGRLYLADYSELQDVQKGFFRSAPKFLSAPLALFAVDKRSGELIAIAVQCEQVPGPDNPVFTPHDGRAWSIAKTIVQIADANMHEAVSHLGRTHLFMEPFVIATERQLAENHPLRLLLRPHFEGTLAINELAHRRLLAPGGFVDELLAGTLEASISLAVAAVRTYRVDEALLPIALRARGVDAAEALPSYPYRDDALLYWNAIHAWVNDYLRTYYRSEADLANDFELASWYRELIAPDGGRVAGFGEDGTLGGLENLIDAATLLVFTSSVQHAAVNFPQFDLMTYTPNMPLAGFTAAPASREASGQDFLDLLPPLPAARLQLVILYLLGTVHYTTLGMYSPGELCDPRLQEPRERFRAELERIGTVIEDRNRVRPPYSFLDRRGIPQSINV